MLRLQPGMMSLSRDSPERRGDIRDLELGMVAGRLGEGEPAAGHERRGGRHAHEPRHAADAGTDASLESGVPGVAVPEGSERGRPGLERVHFGERRPLELELPPEEHRVLRPKVHTLPSPELEADTDRPARAELQAVPRPAGIVGDEVGIPERSAPEPVADLCVETLREGHAAPAHEAARVLQRPQVLDAARRRPGARSDPHLETQAVGARLVDERAAVAPLLVGLVSVGDEHPPVDLERQRSPGPVESAAHLESPSGLRVPAVVAHTALDLGTHDASEPLDLARALEHQPPAARRAHRLRQRGGPVRGRLRP